MAGKTFSILSNILLIAGIAILAYVIVVSEKNKNKKIEESYNNIQQLATSIITYSKEPQTVTVLAGEILRYTNIEEIKKQDNAIYVRR